jgi:hypothetical protein
MTLQEFSERYPSTVPDSTVAIINQLQRGDTFQAGRQAKRVTGGDRRP